MTVLPPRAIKLRSGRHLSVTRLGLGTAPLGNIYRPIPEAESDATLAAAWDCGIRYFDTAPYYGRGLAETRLNRFLRGRERNDYVLSSKVGRILQRTSPDRMVRQTHYFDTPARDIIYDYSRDGILRSVEQSLERLGVDRIDLLLVHDIDPITHGSRDASEAHIRVLLDSGVKAFQELLSGGVIGGVGSGLNVTETTERLVEAMDLDVVLLAGRYTLLEQEPIKSLFPLCQRRGTHVFAAGIFNSGLLAGGSTYNYLPASGETVSRAQRIGSVCAKHGLALAEAALRFAALNPAVAAVIVGAVSPQEVRANVSGFAKSIPAALWAELKDQGLIDREAPV